MGLLLGFVAKIKRLGMVRLMEDIKDLSVEAERELARTFMGRIEWEMIVIGLLQFVVWIVCWVLVINGR